MLQDLRLRKGLLKGKGEVASPDANGAMATRDTLHPGGIFLSFYFTIFHFRPIIIVEGLKNSLSPGRKDFFEYFKK